MIPTNTPAEQAARTARITALRAAVAAEEASKAADAARAMVAAKAARASAAAAAEAALPAALRAEIAALCAAGLDVHVSPEPPPPPARPARVLTWADVSHLDSSDPRRTLYQYQCAYAKLGRPVPAAVVGNLRAAARDDLRRRRVSPRGE